MHYLLQAILIGLLVFFSLGFSLGNASLHHLWSYGLVGILTVIVFGRLRLHTDQQDLQDALRNLGLAVLLFILLMVSKRLVPDAEETVIRYFWYSCYPCFAILGYFTLRTAQVLDYNHPGLIKPRWFKYLLLLDILMCLLVMTNDYHQLVFTFQPGFVDSNTNYGHGYLELPIKAYIILQFLYPLLLLLQDAFRFQYFRWYMNLALVVAGYHLVYNVLYSLGFSTFRHSDMGLVNSVSILAFWYTTFSTGLINYDRRYRELFYASELPQRIAAANLRQQLFLKLEDLVAQERPKLLQAIHELQQETSAASTSASSRKKLLHSLRLSASFIKKQCLMFLQGEMYGYVPLADYQAAIREAVRYVKSSSCMLFLNLEVEGRGYSTDISLITHNFLAKILSQALENNWEGLFFQVQGQENYLEVSVLADEEYEEKLNSLRLYFNSIIKYQAVYNLELQSTEDAVTLKLRFEVPAS